MKGDHKRILNGIAEDTVTSHVQVLSPHSIRHSDKKSWKPTLDLNQDFLQYRSKSHSSLLGSAIGGIMDF